MKHASQEYHALVNSGVVSPPYASQIASGSRKPSLKLAIAIYRATGLKYGPIGKSTKHEIDLAEKLCGGEVT